MITLEPFQEAKVEVYPAGDILAMELIFTPNEQTQKASIVATNQIVPGFRSTMVIQVANKLGKKVRLFPNRCIGNFELKNNAQANVVEISEFIEEDVKPMSNKYPAQYNWVSDVTAANRGK